jgi:hypothetical protein
LGVSDKRIGRPAKPLVKVVVGYGSTGAATGRRKDRGILSVSGLVRGINWNRRNRQIFAACKQKAPLSVGLF